MKNIIILIIFLFFSVVSCQHISYVVISSSSDNCEVLELEPVFEQQFFSINDIVDTIKVIALETSSQSILSNVSLMKMSSEYIVIQDRYQKGNIAIFDINGKFVCRLPYGNGPRDIGNVLSFDVDEHYLYTYQSEKVNKYTLSGYFIESYPILEMYNRHFSSVKVVDDGFLLSIYPCSSRLGKYEVLYTDKEFKHRDLFVFNHTYVGYGGYDDFKTLQKKVVFFPSMSNTVYVFNGNTFSPFYVLRYPKYENTLETNPDCSSLSVDFAQNHCIANKFFSEGRIYQTQDYIYLTFYDGGIPFRVYLNKKNGKFRSGLFPANNDACIWPLKYGLVMCTFNDYFVQILPPERYLNAPLNYDVEGNHLEESVSQLRHISDEDKQKILTAKDDDNPLIIMYKLKSIE